LIGKPSDEDDEITQGRSMMDLSRFFADPGWELLGLVGQLTFGSRFLYQWFISERAGRSVMPVGFWWLSMIGSILILIYAVHKASLAFMLPTFTGVPVYIRNLILIRREDKRRAKASGRPLKSERPDRPAE
jgi:lipid-A-disaccharide synthase-like uncharacterized protein